MKKFGVLFLLLSVLVFAVPAYSQSGHTITNNAELMRNPYAFWSTTVRFTDEFESISTNLVRFGWSRYTEVKGREVTFYVPQDVAGMLDRLTPGDRITVNAMIQSERQGLVVVALRIEVSTHTIRASAVGGGTVTPEGSVKVGRGENAEFKAEAKDRHAISKALVDGRPAASAVGQKTYSQVFENVTRSHTLEVFFERERRTLSVQSAYGTPAPAAGTHSVEDGEEVELRVDSAERTEAGSRYSPAGWEGTGDIPAKGTGTVVKASLTRDSSILWKWRVEHELKVRVGLGGEVDGGGWFPAQAEATLKAAPGEGFRFAGWKGDLPDDARLSNPLRLKMDRPRSLTAFFEKDVLAITASAGKNGTVEPQGRMEVARGQGAKFTIRAREHYHIDEVLVNGQALGDIDGEMTEYTKVFDAVNEPQILEARFAPNLHELMVESRWGSPQPAVGSHVFAYGEEVEVSCPPDPVAGASARTRFVAVGWTGSGAAPAKGTGLVARFKMTGDASVQWQWGEQALLETTAEAGGSVSAGGWVAMGASVLVRATPLAASRFAGWSGDVAKGQQMENPLKLLMDKPRKVTARFERDTVAIRAQAGPNGVVEPSGEVLVDRGTSARFVIEAQPHHHIAEIQINGAPVTGLAAGWVAYTQMFDRVQEPQQFSVSFAKDRYELRIESEHELSDPETGLYELEYGEVLPVRLEKTVVEGAEPGSRHISRGWSGSGDVPARGTGALVRLTASQNSSLSWLWQTEHELKLRAGDGGRIEGQPGWYAQGSSVKLQAIPEEGSKFLGWSGDVPEARRKDNPLTVVMDQRRLIAVEFQQDLVTVSAAAGENGEISPAGEVGVRRGQRAEFFIQAASHFHISKVLVDGEPIEAFEDQRGTYAYVFDKVSAPRRIEAYFARNRYALEIESSQGHSTPPPGVHRFEQGAEVTVTMKEPLVEGSEPGTRHVLKGWTGAGDVPSVGTGTVARFVMDRPSSLKWIWVTENELKLAAVGDGGISGRAGWHPDGVKVTLAAEPRNRSHFENWMGDVPAGRERLNPVEISMDRPRTVTAVFAREQGELNLVVNPDFGVWKFLSAPPDFAGPICGTGSVVHLKAPAGAYVLEFLPIPYYKAPPSQSFTLAAKTRSSFSGTYVPVPELAVSAERLDQHVLAGQGASNLEFRVWNAGHGTLKYAISRNVAWLWLTPKIGTSTGEHDRIRVDFNTAGMSAGSHTALLTVAVRDAEALPREIPVVLHVHNEPGWSTTPLAGSSTPARGGLESGLVAYFPFDGDTLDYSVHRQPGLVYGALSYASHAPFGQAGIFNQRGKVYVEAPHQEAWVLSGSFSIAFWYKAGEKDGRILQKMWPTQRSDRREWEILIRDKTRMLFKYTSPGSGDGFEFLCPLDSEWAPGAWNHYVYAYSEEDNQMTGYLNGVPVTNQVPKYRMVPLDTPLSLLMMNDRYQASTPGTRFDAEGWLDEVAVWNRRLSEDEVRRLYSAPLSREGSGEGSAP